MDFSDQEERGVISPLERKIADVIAMHTGCHDAEAVIAAVGAITAILEADQPEKMV